MTNPIAKYLEGPSYIPLQQFDNGEIGVLESGAVTTIEQCVELVEIACGFIMIESGKAMDVSYTVAERYWADNRDDCEYAFDVPEFIHAQMHNEVYSDIAARRHECEVL